MRGLGIVILALAVGCSSSTSSSAGGSSEGSACGSASDCATGLVCEGGLCRAEEGEGDVGMTTPDMGLCQDGRSECGGACCGVTQSCQDGQRCVEACASGLTCEGACCEVGQVCEQGLCRELCAGQRCGASLELCCTADELCVDEQCVMPGNDCTQTEECDVGEVCEPTVGQCVPSATLCEFRPPVAEFAPSLACRWTPEGLAEFPERNDVVATPIVINLTDDNGDGQTNADDVPEVVFLTYDLEDGGCCNRHATLRIVSGACNPDGTMTTLASLSDPPMDNSGGIAAGDLDGDGVAEIVAVGMFSPHPDQDRGLPQGAVAWKRVADDGSQWEVMWTNEREPVYDLHTRGGALVSLANLDGQGDPEVIIGNTVLDGRTGVLLWDGSATAEGAGIGNNAFLGPSSSVADINLDGQQEVMAGNTLYSATGDILWTYTFDSDDSNCDARGAMRCDGFTAMANFDDDDEGEVVIVRAGEVFVLEHTGELKWRQAIPVDDCNFNESGPPTVADFDGDGRPEIGTAAADFYVVLDLDCQGNPLPEGCAEPGVLWKTANEDCSSRVTASSVFDFEGDGRAEMIYADETHFRIFDGTTGQILFDDDTHGSHTRIEMPIVADVDNDGNSEIIIPENSSRDGTPGLEVFEDTSDNWVRTRRIWNQHAYSVTNIDEDGQIPAQPQPNWLNGRLNNFRQNVQPAGLFDAPDLTVRDIVLDTDACAVSRTFTAEITVANDGRLGVPAGVPVRVFVEGGDQRVLLLDGATTRPLLPAQTELFQVTHALLSDFPSTIRVAAEIDPDMSINECIEDNNASGVEAECALAQ
ncbi:MAG: VCBS repeat-containing protein [Myxococcota bacterium]